MAFTPEEISTLNSLLENRTPKIKITDIRPNFDCANSKLIMEFERLLARNENVVQVASLLILPPEYYIRYEINKPN